MNLLVLSFQDLCQCILRFHEKDQLSVEEITYLFLFLDSHSTLYDQTNHDKPQIDDMHVDG